MLWASLLFFIFICAEAIETPKFAKDFLEYSESQVKATTESFPPQKGEFPFQTSDNGKWAAGPSDTWWTSGYPSGIHWMLYLLTGKSPYLSQALKDGTQLQLVLNKIIKQNKPHNGPVFLIPFVVDAVVRSKTNNVPGLPLKQYQETIVKAARAYAVEYVKKLYFP